MNKRYIILGIIIIFIALITVFLYKPQPQQAANQNAATSTVNNVTYFCQEGILQASYGSNYVTLTFASGTNMLLPQTISGSGIRYSLGSTTFASEGDSAFLVEGSSTPYSNCVGGSEITKAATSTYTDAGKLFSFVYPNQFILSGGDMGYSQDWTEESQDLGILFTVLNIPKSFMPNTNFGSAKFTVGVSSDPDAVKNCLISPNGNFGTTTQTIINGVPFTKITYTDVGAGQYYDVTTYRTVRDNECYAVEYSIHSSDIENYPPNMGIKVFDQAKITSVLESMAQSFKFL